MLNIDRARLSASQVTELNLSATSPEFKYKYQIGFLHANVYQWREETKGPVLYWFGPV